MAVASRASQLPSRYDVLGAVKGWWIACRQSANAKASGELGVDLSRESTYPRTALAHN